MTDFPSFSEPLDTVSDARQKGGAAALAGRVVEMESGLGLEDPSGRVALVGGELRAGDIAAVWGILEESGLQVEKARVLVRPKRAGRPATRAQVDAIRARHRMNAVVRAFFDAQGFVEAETGNLVPSPGTDVHLAAFETHFAGMGPVAPRQLFLHTSPEFAMKGLLVAGMRRIYQICKVYRDGEWTRQHHPEFTMVEWYRAFVDYRAIMADVEALVKAVLDRPKLSWGGFEVDLEAPFERLTVREAFERHCGLDILALDQTEALREAAEARGLGPLSPGGGWDDLFHELMLTHIEPHLGAQRPTFLMDYPRSMAVLSRARDDDPRVAERFELYIAGVELCNGFTELNDPDEQRARFAEDQAQRQALGYPAYPMPEGFLSALEMGMPPAGGVAVGLDRLLMLAVGAQDIGEVVVRGR